MRVDAREKEMPSPTPCRLHLPLPPTRLAGNHLTRAGIGEVVQFARTQGCDATLIDLSDNQLDDAAAVDELTRLVKNYSAFAANNFIFELLLHGNNIGKAGTKPWGSSSRLISHFAYHPTSPTLARPARPPPPLRVRDAHVCIGVSPTPPPLPCPRTPTTSYISPERSFSLERALSPPSLSFFRLVCLSMYHFIHVSKHHFIFLVAAGATKLIQYAHWERDRFKAVEKPPPTLKLNLSDNCIDRPAELVRASLAWSSMRSHSGMREGE